MAYYATVRFPNSSGEPTYRRLRIEAGNILQAALSVELFRLGFTAGSGMECEIIDISHLSRPPKDALESIADFHTFNREIIRGNNP